MPIGFGGFGFGSGPIGVNQFNPIGSSSWPYNSPTSVTSPLTNDPTPPFGTRPQSGTGGVTGILDKLANWADDIRRIIGGDSGTTGGSSTTYTTKSGANVLDEVKKFLGDLVQTGKNIATGAAEGARASAAGANQGSAVGGFVQQNLSTIVLIGAGYVVYRVVKK